MSKLGDNLKAARKALRMSQGEVAAKAKVSQTTISDIERGRNDTSKELPAIAKALGVSVEGLLSGTVDEQLKSFLDNTAHGITTEDLTEEERGNKIWIDFYDVNFCSGDGEPIEFHFDSIKKQLPFEASFFDKRSIKPQNFHLIYNKGDSNEEYLFDGDALGIDTSDTELSDGETYALYFEGDALIRQVFKEQGGVLVLHPRNPKYKDKIISPDIETNLKVIGRVRYRSG